MTAVLSCAPWLRIRSFQHGRKRYFFMLGVPVFMVLVSPSTRGPVRLMLHVVLVHVLLPAAVLQPQYRGDRDHEAFLTPLQDHIERREDLWPALKVRSPNTLAYLSHLLFVLFVFVILFLYGSYLGIDSFRTS